MKEQYWEQTEDKKSLKPLTPDNMFYNGTKVADIIEENERLKQEATMLICYLTKHFNQEEVDLTLLGAKELIERHGLIINKEKDLVVETDSEGYIESVITGKNIQVIRNCEEPIEDIDSNWKVQGDELIYDEEKAEQERLALY